MLSTSNRRVTERLKIFSYSNITKTKRFNRNERFNRFTTDQGTDRFTFNTARNSFTDTNIISVKRLINRRKNNRFITAYMTHRFTHSFSTNRFARRTNIVTTLSIT